MKILALLAVSFLLANCSRDKKEQTQVSIILPTIEDADSLNYVEKNDVGSLITNTAIDFDTGVRLPTETNSTIVNSTSWAQFLPTGYGTTSGVNCYMVTAVEVDAASATPVGTPINRCTSTANPSMNILFNEFDGPVRASANGATLTLSLDMNRTYRFNLIGFHAPVVTGSEACGKIAEGRLVRSSVSVPFLVATHTATVKSEDAIQINMATFDPAKKFDNCIFPNHPINQDPDFLKVSNVLITKQQFPEGMHSSSSGEVCYPLHFRGLNFQDGVAVEKVKVGLHYINNTGVDCTLAGWQHASCSSWSLMGTFRDKQDCDDTGNDGDDDFELVSEAVRWVRTNPAANEADYFRALKVVSGNFVNFSNPEEYSYYVMRKNSIQLNSSNHAAMDVTGPGRVLNGVCAAYTVTPRNYQTGDVSSVVTSRTIEITAASVVADVNDIYLTKSDCESGSTVYPAAGYTYTFSNANSHSAKFYIKAASPDRVRGFIIRDSGGSNPILSTTRLNVQAVVGSSAPQSVKILGNKVQMDFDKCYGPFEVVLQNEIKGAVKNNLGTAIPVLLSTTVGSDKTANVQMFSSQSSSTCTTQVSSLSILPNETSARFFLKVLSNPSNTKPAEGTYQLKASPGLQLKGDSFIFNLD